MTNCIHLRNRVFYRLKPLIPRRTQLWLRGQLARQKRKATAHIWPVLPAAGRPPTGWPGWPKGKRFALVLMHDVESAAGQAKVAQLMRLEQEMGVCSAFNFVPERYRVSPDIRQMLQANGFEVGVHGLNHDGKLFQSRQIFLERTQKINGYLKAWQAVGFCSPASHHNLEWMHDLAIEYDSSTFDTDPFEPQPDGAETIFPFWVAQPATGRGYVELPYTLPQDFTLFILLKERTIDIWRKKLDWIAALGGMALVISHPDYMNFDERKPSLQEYPAGYYSDFLAYVKTQYQGQYWPALPKDVAALCRERILVHS